jgi:hypothetical protein
MTANAPAGLKQTNVNHYVSQFTSRPWLMGTDRFYKLWTDDSGVQATPSGSKNWGSEEHLYSQDVEEAFAKIETKLAALQRKLEGNSPLTDDERYGWAMWLLACYLRTPSAFLSSAEASAKMNSRDLDLFEASYAVLATCVTNPHCIELIADRHWQIAACEQPYFLKPDSGLILTDRLDSEDCLILYPLTPFSCFIAKGRGYRFDEGTSIPVKSVFAFNEHILRWCDRSVACATQFWKDEELMLRDAVGTHLGRGRYSRPTSGRFFTLEGEHCDGELKATILAPRGPIVMTVPESAIRPVDGVERPNVPGLYDIEDCPTIALEVQYSDDDSKVDYAAAARLMLHLGRRDLAVDFARKALQKDKKSFVSKLVILTCEPETDVGDLTPENPDDAALLATWFAQAKREPSKGLEISSTWSRRHPDHKKLKQVTFFCAFLTYGARFLRALCGSGEKLPYINDDTPLPDGTIEFVKRALKSFSDAGIVSEVQHQVGKMNVAGSGFAADILNFCGLSSNLRLYRKS